MVCHLLDTGAAAQHLWNHYVPGGLKEFAASGFGVTVDHAGRLVALWAALHDVGKLTPECQCQAGPLLSGYPAARGQGTRHDAAVHQWLHLALPRLGYADDNEDSARFLVPQLLGGHHGTFHRGRPPGSSRRQLGAFGFRDDEWEQQRQATLAVVREVLGSPDPPPRSSPQAAVLAGGIVVLADWLVSQEPHLLSRLEELPARGTVSELEARRRR